jgi:hypothetical protein
MTAFLWTIVVVEGLGILTQLGKLASGRPDTPNTPGTRVIMILVGFGMLAWALYLLLVP